MGESGEFGARSAGDEDGKDRLRGLSRITLIAIGIALVLFVYFVIADRTTPFSGDARVQAFVVKIAPEVSGRVDRVGVTDNSLVETGDLLFRIAQRPFELAVEQAQARVEQAGQAIGASTASVDVAQARVNQARATEANVIAQTARVLELVERGVYAPARKEQAVAAIEEARAAVQSAEADLERAREQLGPAGADNPQLKEAIAALDSARYDLSRTTLTAPARGVVTNLQLAAGQMVSAGQQAMTFISAEDVWLLADMRENSIGVLATGQSAEVVLDVLPGRVFTATVRSIGWGVASGSVDPTTGLPKSQNATGWLTDPERFPVSIVFDEQNLPRGARYGSKAAVIVYASDNQIMNAIAWARIRLVALLTYVS